MTDVSEPPAISSKKLSLTECVNVLTEALHESQHPLLAQLWDEIERLVAAVNRLCPHRGDMPAGMYETPCPKCLSGDSSATETPREPPEPTPDMIKQGIWAWSRTPSNSMADDVRAIYLAMRRMEMRDSSEETSELPESLRDPIKVMERGRELLAGWGPTPLTDAALAAPARRPCDWPDNHVQPCDCSANEPPPNGKADSGKT